MSRIALRTTAALAVLLAVTACGDKKKNTSTSTVGAVTSSSGPVSSSSAPGTSSSAVASSPSSSAAGAASGSTITIKGFAFTPPTLNIKAGTTVTVNNTSSATHTFTSVSGPTSFDSDRIEGGSSADVKFTKAGTYSYHCSIHNSMTGTVVVS